jgi:hypothetical protein
METSGWRIQPNLSVPARMLRDMSNSNFDDTANGLSIFDDPVSYLADLGIDAEVVAETSMPAAA